MKKSEEKNGNLDRKRKRKSNSDCMNCKYYWKLFQESKNLENAESVIQDDAALIYDSDDSEILNDETIIYDFEELETDDFGQLKFSKSEQV